MDHVNAIRSILFPGTMPTTLLTQARYWAAAFPLIAQSLVDEMGKKIRLATFNGPTAATDSTTIWITPVALPKNESDTTSFLLYLGMKWGLLHHEIGHVNHTDFTITLSREPLLHHLQQLIEDIRQEAVHCRRSKARRDAIVALGHAMVATGIDQAVSDTDSMQQVFTSYLYSRLRVSISGESAYQSHLDIAEVQLAKHFTQAFRSGLNHLIATSVDLQSTSDAFDLAEDMRALLVDEVKRRQEQQQQPAGSSQPSSSSNAPQTDDQADDQDATDSSSASSSDQGESSESAGQSSQSTSDASGSEGPDATTGPDLQDTLDALKSLLDGKDVGDGSRDERVRQSLQDIAQQLVDEGADLIEANLDAIRGCDLQGPACTAVRSGYTVDLRAALTVVGSLRQRLAPVLQAESRAKVGRSDVGTTISEKHLVSSRLGDSRIFKTVKRAQRIDTAIVLLADTSGSMSGRKMTITDQALFAVASALDGLPSVALAVAAFPGNQLVLPFDQRVRHFESNFALEPWGGTPMADGITMATRLLMRRREPRKLLFVLTDGEPDQAASARSAILATRYYGIESFGIGITSNSVQRLFEQHIVISDVGELPAKLMGMIDKRLRLTAA